MKAPVERTDVINEDMFIFIPGPLDDHILALIHEAEYVLYQSIFSAPQTVLNYGLKKKIVVVARHKEGSKQNECAATYLRRYQTSVASIRNFAEKANSSEKTGTRGYQYLSVTAHDAQSMINIIVNCPTEKSTKTSSLLRCRSFKPRINFFKSVANNTIKPTAITAEVSVRNSIIRIKPACFGANVMSKEVLYPTPEIA